MHLQSFFSIFGNYLMYLKSKLNFNFFISIFIFADDYELIIKLFCMVYNDTSELKFAKIQYYCFFDSFRKCSECKNNSQILINYIFKTNLNIPLKFSSIRQLKIFVKNTYIFYFSMYFNLQIETFASIYRKLTGREVTFEFPGPYL